MQMGSAILITTLVILLERHCRHKPAEGRDGLFPAGPHLEWRPDDEQVKWQLAGILLPASLVGLWLLLSSVYA
jgi:hypothetical protein